MIIVNKVYADYSPLKGAKLLSITKGTNGFWSEVATFENGVKLEYVGFRSPACEVFKNSIGKTCNGESYLDFPKMV